ncbi:MAG: diguanylate cyclase [Pseudomonadota bacterium]
MLFFAIGLCPPVQAETPQLKLAGDKSSYSLNTVLAYLEDLGGQLTLQDVMTDKYARQFTQHQGHGAPGFGITTSAFWLKFQWHNPLDTPQTLFLDINNPLLDDLLLYQLDADANIVNTWHTGDAHPFDTRAEPQRTFVFKLIMPANQTGMVYARIYSINMLHFPATLWEPSAFRAHLERIHLILGVCFGILLIMAIYNSFLFVGIREAAYLFYVLYIAIFTVFQTSLVGLIALYFPDVPPWWINRAPLITNPLTIIFTGLFIRSFLNVGKNLPFADKLILGVVLIGTFMILSVLFTEALHTIEALTQLFNMVAVLLAMVIGVWLWLKGLKIARFFLLAWFTLMVSVIISVLRASGVLPSFWLADYALYIGALLEVTLLSLALADRINILRQENIQEHAENLKLQENFAQELQAQVDEQTHSLKIANQELEKISTQDGLTQLYNRRFFDTRLNEEYRRMQRQNEPLSLIMCDVDHFKIFNDTYGHQGGDECLKQVAAAIAQTVRRVHEVSARYGGEEFAVILPHAPQEEAVIVAEKIRQAIADRNIPHEGSLTKPIVAMSFGVATMIPNNDGDVAQLVRMADEALYESKENGRDRVSTYQKMEQI